MWKACHSRWLQKCSYDTRKHGTASRVRPGVSPWSDVVGTAVVRLAAYTMIAEITS